MSQSGFQDDLDETRKPVEALCRATKPDVQRPFFAQGPQKAPKLSGPRAIVADAASYQAMTDPFERLKAVLAERYAIEGELGTGS